MITRLQTTSIATPSTQQQQKYPSPNEQQEKLDHLGESVRKRDFPYVARKREQRDYGRYDSVQEKEFSEVIRQVDEFANAARASIMLAPRIDAVALVQQVRRGVQQSLYRTALVPKGALQDQKQVAIIIQDPRQGLRECRRQ
ncbi:MAG: hypothetical protein QXX17_07950 [Conexivisphaerales archaeon]